MSNGPSKGTYCLLIHLKTDSEISIGKLGRIDFKKGYYFYVGSALNSLEGRIRRHLRDQKKLFWHIDYLLAQKNAEIVDVIFAINDSKWECKIALEIARKGHVIENFGCSDCKCDSHLFFFKDCSYLDDICENAFLSFNLKPKHLKTIGEDLNI